MASTKSKNLQRRKKYEYIYMGEKSLNRNRSRQEKGDKIIR